MQEIVRALEAKRDAAWQGGGGGRPASAVDG